MRGFTLVEAMMSILILGLVAAAAFGTFAAGLKVQSDLADADIVAGLLRSRMEQVLAVSFWALSSGSQSVTYEGKSYTVTWQISGIDLDGDGFNESSARKAEVRIGAATLTTIVVDPGSNVRKI